MNPREFLRDRESGTWLLCLIGSFGYFDANGVEHAVSSKKGRQLLAYLATARGSQAVRTALCSVLWPDKDPVTARGTFRVLLSTLRREIGGDTDCPVEVDGEIVKLRRTVLDLGLVEGMSAGCSDTAVLTQLAEYCAPGLAQEIEQGSGPGGSWTSLLKERFEDCSMRIHEARLENSSGQAKIAAAKALLRVDPFREQSHRLLMQSYAAEGEMALALKQYDSCKNLLWREFGVQVSEKTTAFRQQLLQSSTGPQSGVDDAPNGQSERHAEGVSIVIMPFKASGETVDEQLLADDITAEVIAALTRFRGLFVVAANTTFATRNNGQSTLEIGRFLSVRFATEALLRRSRGQIRISLRLIEVASGREAWAESFTGSIDSIDDIQTEIATNIAASLEVKLASVVADSGKRRKTRNHTAYEYVLRARDLLKKYSLEDARHLLHSALAKDPDYAQCQAWLSFCSWLEYQWDGDETRLLEAAQRGQMAVDSDPHDALCHAFASLAFLFQRNYPLANEHSGIAMKLNPQDSIARICRSDYLYRTGRAAEGVELLIKQMAYDPLPGNEYWESRCLAHLANEQFAEALNCDSKLQKKQWWNYCYEAFCHHEIGDTSCAAASIRNALRIQPMATASRFLRTEPFIDQSLINRIQTAILNSGMPA